MQLMSAQTIFWKLQPACRSWVVLLQAELFAAAENKRMQALLEAMIFAHRSHDLIRALV